MKIQVLKTTLLETLLPLSKINSPDKGLAITSKSKAVTLSVIDEKTQLEMDMPLATADGDGACTVNLALLKSALGAAHAENVELEPCQGWLSIRGNGKLLANLPCKEGADRMIPIPENVDTTALPTGFAGFLLQAFQSAGKDATRPVLDGVDVSGNGIAGTDGKRLTHIPLPLSLKGDVVLPPSPLYAALRKYRWSRLCHWDELAAIAGVGFRLLLRRQEGSYPNYLGIYPKEGNLDVTAEISAADVPKAVEFLTGIPKEDKGLTSLMVFPDCIQLAARQRKTVIGAKSNAETPCGIYINEAFLLQAFGLGHTRLSLSSKGVSVVSAEGGTGHFLFMPLQGRPDAPTAAVPATVATASNTKNTTNKETKTMTTTIQTPVPAPVANAFHPAATPPPRPTAPGETEPLTELSASISAMREYLDSLNTRLAEAARKIREAQLLQRQKERQYADATRKLERIRLAV